MEVAPEESILNNDTKNGDAEVKQVTTSTTKKSTSSSARARAEARRRRILESSAKRYNVVSGEVPASVPTTKEISPHETEGDTQCDDMNKEDNEKKEETTEKEAGTDETNKPTSTATKSVPSRSASSIRLAQMRRRRFKKDQSSKKEDTETATASSEEKKPKDDGAVVSKEEDQATITEALNVSNDAKTELVTEVKTSEVQPGEEKKYLGVARMRRKRLAEKKKKEESEATAVESSNINVLKKSHARSLEKVNTLPIYFHLFITLILFSLGIQTGLEQHSHIVWEEGMVVNELSVKESRILSYLQYKKEDESALKSFTMDDHSPDVGIGEDDEFSTDEFSTEYFNAESEKIIDPIFRMDLDELTQGPSFLNKIARIAVRCHRALFAMVIFFPQTLLSIPNAILTTKCYPYFFFISAFLRQSSALIGATIPPKNEDEEDSNKKDLVTMMIAGAKDMIGKSVPGFSLLKSLYNFFQEGRDDMMVVFCGLLFGLALPLMKMDSVDYGNREELGAIGEEL